MWESGAALFLLLAPEKTKDRCARRKNVLNHRPANQLIIQLIKRLLGIKTKKSSCAPVLSVPVAETEKLRLPTGVESGTKGVFTCPFERFRSNTVATGSCERLVKHIRTTWTKYQPDFR